MRLRNVAIWCVSLALAHIVPVTAAPLFAPTPAQYTQAMGLSDHYASLVDRRPTAPVWVDAGHFLYRRGVARSAQLPAIEYRLRRRPVAATHWPSITRGWPQH